MNSKLHLECYVKSIFWCILCAVIHWYSTKVNFDKLHRIIIELFFVLFAVLYDLLAILLNWLEISLNKEAKEDIHYD